MDFQGKTKEWLIAHEDEMNEIEYQIYDRIMDNYSFIIQCGDKDTIASIAKALQYEVLEISVRSIDDLKGSQVIMSNDSETLYFADTFPWWVKEADSHPNKRYLILINIDDADGRTLRSLTSDIKHSEIDRTITHNFIAGLMYTDSTRQIPSDIRSVLGSPIKCGK